jgi:hypothetical protein
MVIQAQTTTSKTMEIEQERKKNSDTHILSFVQRNTATGVWLWSPDRHSLNIAYSVHSVPKWSFCKRTWHGKKDIPHNNCSGGKRGLCIHSQCVCVYLSAYGSGSRNIFHHPILPYYHLLASLPACFLFSLSNCGPLVSLTRTLNGTCHSSQQQHRRLTLSRLLIALFLANRCRKIGIDYPVHSVTLRGRVWPYHRRYVGVRNYRWDKETHWLQRK